MTPATVTEAAVDVAAEALAGCPLTALPPVARFDVRGYALAALNAAGPLLAAPPAVRFSPIVVRPSDVLGLWLARCHACTVSVAAADRAAAVAAAEQHEADPRHAARTAGWWSE